VVSRRHILREYREAGSVNACLALWGFVDDTTFLTKAGHVGVVYRLRGVDDEGLTHAQRQRLTHRFEGALRLLDDRCRVSQYLVKRTVAPCVAPACDHPIAREAMARRAASLNARRHALYELVVHLVVLYEAPHVVRRSTTLRRLWRAPRQAWQAWLSPTHTQELLASELDRAIGTLHRLAQAFEVQTSDLGPARLGKADAFHFFRTLVNYAPAVVGAARLTYDTHLDYFVADSAVDCHRDHLIVGDRVVKVLSMKEPPSQTFAFLLREFAAIPGEFVACLEWQRLPSDRMRRDLQRRRRHFFNARVSIANYLSPDTGAGDMLVDDSAQTTVRQLGDALTEMEVHGHVFGTCSLTLVLHGPDPRTVQQQAAEAMKAMAVHDGSLFEETYNLLNAWLSVVPGNGAHNLRRLALLETNVADLSFLFTRDPGDPVSPHLGRAALALFETPHHTTYAYNLHLNDVGHTLVLGATGSGKSFLLNFLITHAQQYAPQTVVLDIGHSYRTLVTLLGGQYLSVGLHADGVTLNPFALDPTPDHLHFLHAFVRVLLEGDDGYRVSDREDREIYDAVENLYVLDRPQRRLGTLATLLPRALAGRLHRWVGDGRYAGLFDHVEDTLTVARLQAFDFQAMRAYPALLEPLLFYVLHRVVARIQDPAEASTLKLCVVDEAWRVIQHPTLRAYVADGLKTWRKHNAAMVLATQTIEDFASVDLLRTVVESCPTKLLLANPALDRPQYAELFQLNERELDLLTGLIPRQQILLKRPALAKVLTLTVDPKSAWIYTNTPADNARVTEMLREYGVDTGLDRLVVSTAGGV
jgi:type IV secretion system protein VirB4